MPIELNVFKNVWTYKNLKCKQLFSYKLRLSNFQISSLQKCRKALDVMFLSKLINGFIAAPDTLEFLCFFVPRPGRPIHNHKTFSLPPYKSNIGQHWSVHRMCSSHNAIRFAFDTFTGSTVSARNTIINCLMR